MLIGKRKEDVEVEEVKEGRVAAEDYTAPRLGRPRRWRRRRTALFRLPGQRQRPSSESRASERAAKAAAATLSMGWYGVVVHEAAGRVSVPVKPLARAREAVSSVRRTAPTRSRRAALL